MDAVINMFWENYEKYELWREEEWRSNVGLPILQLSLTTCLSGYVSLRLFSSPSQAPSEHIWFLDTQILEMISLH